MVELYFMSIIAFVWGLHHIVNVVAGLVALPFCFPRVQEWCADNGKAIAVVLAILGAPVLLCWSVYAKIMIRLVILDLLR